MLDDDEFSDLPEDPELAFVEIEKKLRIKANDLLKDSEGNVDSYYIEYINKTLAAARALKLDILQNWTTPSHNGHIWEQYRDFSSDVEHYTMQIRINSGRRSKVYSVALNSTTKAKIRHYLDQIRDIIDKLEVSKAKKEALYARVNDLAFEVDRERTRLDAWAGLSLEAASTVGESARKLNPLRKWLDVIAKTLGAEKEAETARPGLPRPQKRKQLEAPPKRLPKPERDDEIPF